MSMPSFLKKNAVTLLLVAGIIAYVVVAGRTRFCATCAFITDSVGLSETSGDDGGAPGEEVVWSVVSLDGAILSSDALKGQVVIVDFWATWCPPCRRKIPSLIELQESYKEDGLVIVGISADEDGPRVVREFAAELGMLYPLAMADDAVIQAFGGIEGLPTSFIINREGQVTSRHVGYTDKSVFENTILDLL